MMTEIFVLFTDVCLALRTEPDVECTRLKNLECMST